jgi:Holliday junction resolvase RusA-like endonuclease
MPTKTMQGVNALIPTRKEQPREPGFLEFSIPLVPPSVNHYKQPNGRGGWYVTKEANAFIDAVSYIGKPKAKTLPIAGMFYEVSLEIFVLRKKFLRADSDNMEKVAFDALTAAGLIKDDRYITLHHNRRIPVETAAQERTEYQIIGREEA